MIIINIDRYGHFKAEYVSASDLIPYLNII